MKYNGTRKYTSEVKILEGDDWTIKITRIMHGVDSDFFFDKNFFESPEGRMLRDLNHQLNGLLTAGQAYIQRGEKKYQTDNIHDGYRMVIKRI